MRNAKVRKRRKRRKNKYANTRGIFNIMMILFRFGIIYQGSRPTIFIRDVEFLKSVCIKDFDHFTNFFGEGLETIVDNNVFFMQGEKWRVSKVLTLILSTARAQFHQRFMYSFMHAEPKSVKNTVKSSVSFYAFGICGRKSCT